MSNSEHNNELNKDFESVLSSGNKSEHKSKQGGEHNGNGEGHSGSEGSGHSGGNEGHSGSSEHSSEHSHSSGHKSSHKHRSLKSKIKHSRLYKKLKRNKKITGAIIAFLIIFVIGVAALIYVDQQQQGIYDVNTASRGSSGGAYSLKYDGETYDYNTQISSILLIGVDSTGDIRGKKTYGDAARADNIILVILDKGKKRVRLLPISRDTITEVNQFTARGYDAGSTKTHIGFAYQFGNGGRASCKNTCNAVSNLLYGIPVNQYITTNLDSLGFANSLVGGVTVTVPNDDLAARYPEMTKGAKVKLTDSNIEDFLRYRDTNVTGSNNGRMERQQAFMEAFIKKLQNMTTNDYEDMWEKLQSDDSNVMTNIKEGTFIKLLKSMNNYSYNPDKDNLKIKGTDSVEDGYDVFYPDKKLLKKQVIDTFYIK